MIIRTLEDKLINVNQYKVIYLDVNSGTHGTSYALMITDYTNSECLGCWDVEKRALEAIGVLIPGFTSPNTQGYLDLSTRVPSTMPAPVQKKK